MSPVINKCIGFNYLEFFRQLTPPPLNSINKLYKQNIMDNEFAKHEIDYITRYEEKGFTASFIFKAEKLVETVSKNSYKPEQIFVVEERRFEGMSNPSDSSLLYIIETNDGKKGTFLVAYGPQADIEIADFFKAIPSGNYINKK